MTTTPQAEGTSSRIIGELIRQNLIPGERHLERVENWRLMKEIINREIAAENKRLCDLLWECEATLSDSYPAAEINKALAARVRSAGLLALTGACNKAAIPFASVSVGIYTDSTIVRNWLNRFERFKPQNCKNERRLVMGKLAGQCVSALKPFKAWSIEWNSRDCNVAKFGH